MGHAITHLEDPEESAPHDASATADLYGMKHSHPVLASRMAVERAAVEFKAHDLFPGLHGVIVRSKGFARWTVPALVIDGRRVQGTLAIARELDRIAPDVGLFPRDPERRREVEAAERLGHDELQPIARRVFRWAGARDNAVRAWMAQYVVGTPAPRLAGYLFKPAMVFFSRVVSKADAARVREDLGRLPSLLDRVDALLEDGTIGGESPNAADLQILTSVRLLMAHEDLRPAIAPRPCGAAALALIPEYPRARPDALPPVPASLPVQWLPRTASDRASRRAGATPISAPQRP
jgi:glutathione S-transferase